MVVVVVVVLRYSTLQSADNQSDSIGQGSVLFFFFVSFFILHTQPRPPMSKLSYFQPRRVSSLKHTKKSMNIISSGSTTTRNGRNRKLSPNLVAIQSFVG